MGIKPIDYLSIARRLKTKLGRGNEVLHSCSPPLHLHRNGHQQLSSAEIAGTLQKYKGAKKRELITKPAQVEELAMYLSDLELAAIDIETTGLSPIEDRVRLLSLHTRGHTYLIDCFAVDPSPALEVLKDKVLYVHGAEFDLPFLYHSYAFLPSVTPVDTLHLSQVVRAGEWAETKDKSWIRLKHSLSAVLERELGVRLASKSKYQRGEAWVGELTEEHLDYATGDVVHLQNVADKLAQILQERGLEEVWKLEQRAKPLFLNMCIRGLPFDKLRWDLLAKDLQGKVAKLKEKADEEAPPHPQGAEWNWFSPKQAKEAFKHAGLDIPNLRRETLASSDHPLVKAVSEYRDARNSLSRVSTWYEGRYKDGHIHPQWNPAGAATGRASCTSPNVQSLTKKGGYRSCIRTKSGQALIKADLSQIELRVLAAVLRDENMLEIFRGGGDIHLNTARALTGREVEKGSPERQRAKAVNFGLSFGMGAKRFQEVALRDYGVEMDLEEAKEAKRKLLDAYPAIGRWHAREAQEAYRGNFVTRTLLGRRRVVEPDRKGKPSFTERLNAPVQGTAADILKLAMARLWEGQEGHPNAWPILTVHDEIVIECDALAAEHTAIWLAETLRSAVSDVLGHPELAGEDVVKISVLDSWGSSNE